MHATPALTVVSQPDVWDALISNEDLIVLNLDVGKFWMQGRNIRVNTDGSLHGVDQLPPKVVDSVEFIVQLFQVIVSRAGPGFLLLSHQFVKLWGTIDDSFLFLGFGC